MSATPNRPTPARAKSLARLLRADLAAADVDIPHSLALELVAHQHGAGDWNTLVAGAAGAGRTDQHRTPTAFAAGIPVLRVLSAEVAVRFYTGYLGFAVDWEHRFEPRLPLYVQVSRGQTRLHLSEHHGDGTPHCVVWIPVADVQALRDELHAHRDVPLRPDVDPGSPGGPTLEVTDPYGNVLRFCQPPGAR